MPRASGSSSSYTPSACRSAPGFFNSLRADGLRLMSPALAVVLLGTGLAVAMSYTLHVSMPDMSGILCGATTNTPALGRRSRRCNRWASTPAAPP